MKTLKILLQVVRNNHEEITKKAWAGKVLRYILFSLMLSSATLLSSCAVDYATTDYPYDDSFGVYINPWNYGWRHEHREWIHQHPRWRYEYPRHRVERHERDRH